MTMHAAATVNSIVQLSFSAIPGAASDHNHAKHSTNTACMQGSTELLKLQCAQSPDEQPALTETQSRAQPWQSSGVQSAGFVGDYFLLPAPMQDIEWKCQQPGQLVLDSQPAVYLLQDHAQLSHFLTVQVAPLYMVHGHNLFCLCGHMMQTCQLQCKPDTDCTPAKSTAQLDFHLKEAAVSSGLHAWCYLLWSSDCCSVAGHSKI